MNIPLPKFLTPTRKKTLRATAVRRPLRIATTADYDDLAEPNMKLSRALLIVLLLHVVAVSGIIAFNAIKTRQGPVLPATHPALAATDASPDTSVATHPASKDSPRVEIPRATKVSAKTTKEDRKPDHAKASSNVADSGKTHVVERGETPLSISHKYKVPFDDLLAINHIDDPKTLQIGKKLIIPARPKTKKSE